MQHICFKAHVIPGSENAASIRASEYEEIRDVLRVSGIMMKRLKAGRWKSATRKQLNIVPYEVEGGRSRRRWRGPMG